MSNAQFAIAVTFDIKEEFVEAFHARIVKQAEDSIANEPGCVQFDVLIDENQPSTFFLYETYVNAQAFESHKQTPHFADYDATVSDWVIAKNVRRLEMVSQNRS